MLRTNWRSTADWRAEGLAIGSTVSDEAVKLYDAAITQVSHPLLSSLDFNCFDLQLIGWFDDPNMGGLPNTIDNMVSADPDFGLELIGTGTTVRLDNKLKTDLEALVKLADKKRNQMQDREYKHVLAVEKFAAGDWTEAAHIWEEILVDHPTDVQALKFGHDCFFYLGRQTQIKDSIARVLPIWKQSSLPLKSFDDYSNRSYYQFFHPINSYIHGMYAFGLEESKFYSRAEREARYALECNRNDGWATHAVSHVMVMEGRVNEGIDFMSSTVDDWQVCNYLACHNFWHWAIFHIEKEEFDSAISLFDSQIGRRALETGMMLDIVDACSLLYRLDLIRPKEFVNDKHWSDVYSTIESHLNDHILGFNDAHFMMACLGAQHKKEAYELIETFDPLVSSDSWTKVTVPLLEAMVAFNEERYEQTVEKLNKIRYDLLSIGGSDAQRDVFNQLLIVAALKSPKQSHKRLCERLIAERKALNDSPFANTLLSVK